ncbi:uridine kinase family protein [Salinicoccus kekensis]|uniref:Uridine kinase n=1 Tax=Salinicoccus kekensis TaxID=714307 RepID=A0A285UGR5_9STAP|nr:phosphoribulokinase [Salinicoccus kekensis]SOC40598.1 uridine kinase [Salinicoccus kekensis]
MEILIKKITEIVNSSEGSFFIGVSGHGASGKTTFSKSLCEALYVDYNLLHTDSYIIENHHLSNTYACYETQGNISKSKITACMPIRHELNSLARDIELLKKGHDLITIDKPWDSARILKGSKKVTIVEGMSVAFLEPFAFNFSIYIYTDSKTELSRRKKRDVEDRGRDLESLINAQSHRRDQYDLFMHPLKDKFDVIVDNSDDMFKIIKSNL